MTYLWPGHLWLLLALPLLPLLYVWLLRRRGKRALRYSNLDLVRQASVRLWRRHVPQMMALSRQTKRKPKIYQNQNN